MSASHKRRQCVTLIWRIENYSRCLHRKGHQLTSPHIGVSDEERGEWQIWIYPVGQQEDYIDLEIVRYANEGGNTVQCEFSLLATDGSPSFVKKGRPGGQWAWNARNFVKQEVITARKSEFLPEDTWTVQCCAWGSSVRPRDGAETHIAHTKIVEAGDRETCKLSSSFKNFTRLRLPLVNGPDETVPPTHLSNVTCVQVCSHLSNRKYMCP